MNVLMVQPPWKRPPKSKDPQKYFSWPLIKLAGLYRKQGHKVAIIFDEPVDADQGGLFQLHEVPFVPDRMLFTTVFSYWFMDVKKCIERYQARFPNAEIHIGGIHASLSPELYKEHFPKAYVHEGVVPEAETAEPAWDLVPGNINTQIIRFSAGCIRKCVSFCYGWKEPYRAFPWEEVAPRIRYNRVILNDNNFLGHPSARTILKNLAEFQVNGKPISSVEIQGGMDVRLLSQDGYKDIVPLLKAAKVRDIRLAWDGGLDMYPMIDKSLERLIANGYSMKRLRCYVLYNHDLPFTSIVEKLKHFERWKLGPIHSRFRPKELLRDGYVQQKRHQAPGEYYIHPGWTDAQVRAAGSLASDISRMARADVDTLDEVRSYYGRRSAAETIALAAA